MTSTFVIHQPRPDLWAWRLEKDGNILARSDGAWESRDSVLLDIGRVQEAAAGPIHIYEQTQETGTSIAAPGDSRWRKISLRGEMFNELSPQLDGPDYDEAGETGPPEVQG